jgi:hypothetical protein
MDLIAAHTESASYIKWVREGRNPAKVGELFFKGGMTYVAVGPLVMNYAQLEGFGALAEMSTDKGWSKRTYYVVAGDAPLLDGDDAGSYTQIGGQWFKIPSLKDRTCKTIDLLKDFTRTLVVAMYDNPAIQYNKKNALRRAAMLEIAARDGLKKLSDGDDFTLPQIERANGSMMTPSDPDVRELACNKFVEGSVGPFSVERDQSTTAGCASTVHWTHPLARSVKMSKNVFTPKREKNSKEAVSYKLDPKVVANIPPEERVSEGDFNTPELFEKCLHYARACKFEYSPVVVKDCDGNLYQRPELNPKTGEPWDDKHLRLINNGSVCSLSLAARPYSNLTGAYGVKFMFGGNIQLIEERQIGTEHSIPDGRTVDMEVVDPEMVAQIAQAVEENGGGEEGDENNGSDNDEGEGGDFAPADD